MGLMVLKKITKHFQMNLPTSDLPRKKKKKKKRRRRRRRIDNYGRETINMLLASAYAFDSSLFVGKL